MLIGNLILGAGTMSIICDITKFWKPVLVQYSPYVCPSFIDHIPGVRSWWQQAELVAQTHFVAPPGDSYGYPGLTRYIISTASSSLSLGLLPVPGSTPNSTPRRHPSPMPEQPLQAPFNATEQRLCFGCMSFSPYL